MASIPLEVLGDALVEARRGRSVRAAVFTTFTFDPGFFELHILPLLFDRMSQVEKVKRIQLEELLRSVDVAVYYDRTGLSQDALPSHANFQRIDLRRHGKGVFHPKLVFLLVDDPQPDHDDEVDPAPVPLSLIVGVLSANLTRGGWWENVETGHFEEIKSLTVSDSRIPYRKDLLGLVRRIRALAPDDDHRALDQIHEFLRDDTVRDELVTNRYDGTYYTRLFAGQTSLPSWLDEVRLGRGGWNLEVVSPYFDKNNAGTLEALIDVLDPREVRVFLPCDPDGAATVTESLYLAMKEVAHWSTLPTHITRPSGRASVDTVPPRRVHAKVYRLWHRDGPEVVLTGSVNLTSPAHSHAGAGNLEAAFLVDVTTHGRRQWWLQPIEHVPSEFAEDSHSEADEAQQIFLDVSFQFDWRTHELTYRVEGEPTDRLSVCDLAGRELFVLDNPVAGDWQSCAERASQSVASLLRSTSFLEIQAPRGRWRVLVREEGMSHRPSFIAELTPEEILMYWSLLSPEQREAFIEKKLQAEAMLEGLASVKHGGLLAEDTIFDRFAGVYHAFGRLLSHVDRAIEHRQFREAEARLFGAQYDSLPVLLERLAAREDGDVIMNYVTFLCAAQTRDLVRRQHRDFWNAHKPVRHRLEDLIERLPLLEATILPDDPEREKFLEWYKRMFMKRISLPEDSE